MLIKQNQIFKSTILMYSEGPKFEENILKPRKIAFPQSFDSRDLKKVYATANRSYVVFENEVFSWGDLIFKNEEENVHDRKQAFNAEKKSVIIPIRVSELALGSRHTFAYGQSDEMKEKELSVYCWGSNKNYELGLEEQRLYGLQKVDLFDQAFEAGFILNEISCGDSHTLAVFKDEQTGETKLFGWGESKSYQLALDTTGIIPYPVDIDYDFTSSIDKVYSKSDYNIVILNDGDLYSWGSNMFNRLGLNHAKKPSSSKFQSENHKTENSPNTSRQAIHFLKDSNSRDDISFTDRRPINSESTSTSIQKVKIPRKIEIFNKKIHQLALGTYHVIALTQQGECFSWGNGIYGQLGNNKFGECPPQKISTKHLSSNTIFMSCSAGERHSCLLDQQGNVYTCGSNSYGVLGHQKHENQQKNKRCKIFEKVDYFQENNMKVCSLTSGDRHILALSEENEVYGWGSNKFHQVCIPVNSINYVENKKQYIQKGMKQSRIRTSKKQDLNNQISIQNHVKFEQPISHQELSEAKLFSMKMKEHLHNLPQQSGQGLTMKQKLNDWKQRFNQFLTQKRKQEDEFMVELDLIINEKEK